jgi:hypothetical protein
MSSSLRVLAVLLAAVAAAPGQGYTDYEWAKGLAREYGFDDIAERILEAMVKGGGRSAADQQMGRLGLAELKASQAQRTGDLAAQLALYEEARQIMQQVVGSIQDRNSPEYQKAIFAYVDLLQEKGEKAMSAVADGRVPEEKADEIRRSANADYARAEGELEKIRTTLAGADASQNREKWRLRNRAWYSLCLLQLNKAMTHRKGGAQRALELAKCRQTLEEFILENENSDDDEALLGALYGYILMGQVCKELGEEHDAIAYFSSVFDQIDFSSRLHPAVQPLFERALYHLFSYQNELKRFDSVKARGKDVEERYRKFGMEFGLYGRAARVALAQARLQTGDMNGALAIAAQVTEAGGNDGAARLANQLISDILGSAQDKTQFSADIVASAARGAYSRGKEKREEALRYYQLVTQLLDKVRNEQDRSELGAEAWYRIGSIHYLEDRFLEAAAAYREGALKFASVKKDDLGSNLVKYWQRSLELAFRATGSAEAKRLLDQCKEWQVQSGVGATKARGSILYDQGRDLEAEALALDRDGKSEEALAAYDKALQKFRESVAAGGPDQERALIKAAKIGQRVGKIHLRRKDKARALPLIAKARDEFESFLRFAADPAQKLTDPQLIAGRESARAEARYNIAEGNRILAEDESDPEVRRKLNEQSEAILDGFEKDHAGQRSLALFAVAERLAARLALGKLEAAEADLLVLKGLDPTHTLTVRAILDVGKALRTDAEAALNQAIGKARPGDGPAWTAVEASAAFQAARPAWKRVCDHYRDWLLVGPSERFSDWDAVSAMYWMGGFMEEAGDLVAQALQRFDLSKASKDDLVKLQARGLVAWVRQAQAKDAAGDADGAGRLWNQAGRAADVLMTDERYGKMPPMIRLAAITYGGYVGRQQGLPKLFPALGKPGKALSLWENLTRRGQATGDHDLRWEGTFYHYLTAMQQQKAEGRGDLRALRERLISLEATSPELGGEQWKPLFDWLKRQM